jgi:uncharacterized membrane protein
MAGIDAPPKGLILEDPAAVAAHAQMIYQQAVATETMPLGNLTNITPQERQTLGAWIQQGAKLR